MSLISKLSKLRAMGPEEIGFRVADWAFAQYERRRVDRAQRFNHRDLAADPERAADGPSGHFFQGFETLEATRATLCARFSSQVAATIARANDALAHRYELFTRTYDLGSAIDWHVDPPTGIRWPRMYHADVMNAAPEGVDPKHVWELNRQQFMPDLGRAWLLTGDRKYVGEIGSVVRGWCDQNPTGSGVNWAGPLEVAYRALSWLWTYHLVAPALDAPLSRTWNLALREHARFLYRHLELYASPYNHLIGEAAVLYMLGVQYSHRNEAARWRRRGRQILEARLVDQFYQDGGSVEQAVVYHHATLGFYLLAALLGRANGEELSASVWQTIERGIEHAMYLMQPDGLQPAIGDNDDARPIRFERLEAWDFRHFQAIGALVFDRADFACTAGRCHEDVLWLLGADAPARFAGMRASAPVHRSIALEASGYVVLRNSWAPDSDYVCFDAGEQAGGLRTDSIPSAAHGHSDCLSIVAGIGGRPVLVDAGFYTYNGDVRWERYFRETVAHNTVRIDGRDQGVHLDKMAWAQVPRATLEAFELNDDGPAVWTRGSHDAYSRLRPPVLHRRWVVLTRRSCIAVFDELLGEGDHELELAFQLPPGLAARLCGLRLELGDDLVMLCASAEPLTAELKQGDEAVDGGWVAPTLGVLVPAPRFSVKGRLTAPGTQILTVVARRSAWQAGELIDAREWPAAIEASASRRLQMMARQAARSACADQPA